MDLLNKTPKILLVFIFFLSLILLTADIGRGATEIGNLAIDQDTHWNNDKAPYLVDKLIIPEGITLTVEAGTIVEFRQQGQMTIHGKLIIQGTAENQVVFTALKRERQEDLRGDTNSNELIVNSKWQGLVVEKAGKLVGDYLNISSGEYGITTAGALALTNSLIQGEKTALEATGGHLSLQNCQISTKPLWGAVGIKGYGTFDFEQITFRDNYYPVEFTDLSQTFIQDSKNNIYQNNIYNGFILNSGVITASNTLKAIEDAYIIRYPQKIAENVRLNIEGGSLFKFASAVGWIVKGELHIQGRPSRPVIFTSLKDDSCGGDTDGKKDTPGAGDGGSLIIEENGSLFCAYGKFYYGGYATAPHNSYSFINVKKGGKALILNSLFYDYYKIALETAGDLQVIDSVLTGGQYGIKASGGQLKAEKCLITTNTDDYQATGIYGYGNFELRDNQFRGNYYPVNFVEMGKTTFTAYQRNTYLDNVYRGCIISGTVNDSNTLKPLDEPYIISSWLAVAKDAQLMIEPGVILKFHQGRTLTVYGKLEVKGTPQKSVFFTSIKDDRVGGNSDGAALLPTPKDWTGITVTKTGEFNCNYGVLRHGGFQKGALDHGNLVSIAPGGKALISNTKITNFHSNGIGNQGNLEAQNLLLAEGKVGIVNYGNLLLAKNLFKGLKVGVRLLNGNQIQINYCNFINNDLGIGSALSNSTQLPQISNNNFIKNTLAIQNTTAVKLDCTWNYWNHPAGPSTYDTKARTWTTLGDRLEGRIDYTPYYELKVEKL